VTNTLLFPTGTPQRGDVIVFRLPPNPKINYIKRLVGLPGDRVRVDEKNQLYINDVPSRRRPAPSTRDRSRTCGTMRAFRRPSSSWGPSAIRSCSPTAA
jgi:signal peptidase I